MEGGFGRGYMPSGLGTAYCHECSMDQLSLWPCGLGCQQLIPRYYACSGHNYICSYLTLGGIMSCPTPFLYSPGEDSSPKPPAIHEMLGYILAMEHWYPYLAGRALGVLTDHALN